MVLIPDELCCPYCGAFHRSCTCGSIDETLEKICDEINAIASSPGDEEIQHGRADDLLCAALKLLGRRDIADAFAKARQGFWYA